MSNQVEKLIEKMQDSVKPCAKYVAEEMLRVVLKEVGDGKVAFCDAGCYDEECSCSCKRLKLEPEFKEFLEDNK